MVNNVLGQGRQTNFVTTSNKLMENFTNESLQTEPITSNEKIEKKMEPGSENQKNIKEKDVKKAVDKLNKFLEGEKTHVEFERHDKFKSEFIVKIVDNETKEVIREVPPKKILDMVAKMCELAGVMFDKKA